MPTVMIYQSPRTPQQRAAALAAVTDALVEAYGLRPDQVYVYFHEVDDDQWGRSGALATERRTGGRPPR